MDTFVSVSLGEQSISFFVIVCYPTKVENKSSCRSSVAIVRSFLKAELSACLVLILFDVGPKACIKYRMTMQDTKSSANLIKYTLLKNSDQFMSESLLSSMVVKTVSKSSKKIIAVKYKRMITDTAKLLRQRYCLDIPN